MYTPAFARLDNVERPKSRQKTNRQPDQQQEDDDAQRDRKPNVHERPRRERVTVAQLVDRFPECFHFKQPVNQTRSAMPPTTSAIATIAAQVSLNSPSSSDFTSAALAGSA